MKRPSYKQAVAWLANEDDNSWAEEAYDVPSVAAALTMDLFCVSRDRLRMDILKRIRALKENQ